MWKNGPADLALLTNKGREMYTCLSPYRGHCPGQPGDRGDP
jgi:hypothetical protein